MAVVLTPAMKAILEEHAAVELIQPWMVAEQLKGIEDIALLATKEEDVPTKFTALIEPPVHGVKNKLACVKVWRSCRNQCLQFDVVTCNAGQRVRNG